MSRNLDCLEKLIHVGNHAGGERQLHVIRSINARVSRNRNHRIANVICNYSINKLSSLTRATDQINQDHHIDQEATIAIAIWTNHLVFARDRRFDFLIPVAPPSPRDVRRAVIGRPVGAAGRQRDRSAASAAAILAD